MLPYLGNFSLWLSLVFAFVQFVNFKKKNDYTKFPALKVAAYGLLFASFISFFTLMYGYVISDFSLSNVYENSHTSKPLIYKISAVWGNHEGSMLLWILVLTIFNFFIFKCCNKSNFSLFFKALKIQSFIIIGFLLFTIFTSNPFEKIEVIQNEGMGFNPILQDPALAIHPPFLYIGYVGFSAVFSLSIAVMKLNEKEKINWPRYMKPFVLSSWTFLTIGIALGSIWAYYELGWGGWWFWDPVENASFMPWLLGTALIHSLIIVEKKKSLQNWVLLLGILVFLLSVIGTFLVRSGILTSVHTFALDPSRGIYILAFCALLGGYSLILFFQKSRKYTEVNYFSFFSKEGAILINNILMIVVCATVFLGTIYPLLVEIFTNNKISVGEPFYNSTVIPIILPAIVIMGIGPLLSWERDSIIKIFRETVPGLLVTIIMTVIFYFIYQTYSIIGLIGILLAFWIISNNLIIIVKKIAIKYKFKKNINYSTPNLSYGMIIAHLGIGFLILGITASSIWQKEKIIRMKINSDIKIHEYNIFFKEINEVIGPNYIAIQGNFLIYDQQKSIIAKLKPEKRFYTVTKNFTTEASIHTNLLRDLYIVIGDGDQNKGWVVRIYYNPLVIWIWIGALTIFIGGIISTKNNLKILKILSI